MKSWIDEAEFTLTNNKKKLLLLCIDVDGFALFNGWNQANQLNHFINDKCICQSISLSDFLSGLIRTT